MGIFKEDLINLGNLIDTEVEVSLKPEDFKRHFEDLDFEFKDTLVIIRGKKKVLFFNKSFEFRGKQVEDKVYNEREYETKDLGIYLLVISRDGMEELLKRKEFKEEGDYLRMSIWDVLRKTETYSKIPDAFKERLMITKYKVKENSLSVFITVTK